MGQNQYRTAIFTEHDPRRACLTVSPKHNELLKDSVTRRMKKDAVDARETERITKETVIYSFLPVIFATCAPDFAKKKNCLFCTCYRKKEKICFAL